MTTRTGGRAAAAALLLALLAPGCAPSGSRPSPEEEALRRMALAERVAQLVLVPLADPARDAPDLLPLAGGHPAGGLVLRGGEAATVAGAVRRLPPASPHPLLVAAEVDGGLGAHLAGATDFPSLAALAAWASPDDARAAAGHIAREARDLGVNLGLVRGPPLHGGALPLPYRDPQRAAAGLAAFARGAADAGLPLAFRTLWSPDPDAPPLDWDRARLEAVDLPLLRAALASGAAVVEIGAARLPALAGDARPLPASAAAVGGLLRRDLEWESVVAVELGEGSALVRETGAGEAAVLALAAGADLLIGPERPDSVVAAVTAAVERGRLPAERVDEAVRRVLALRARLPAPAGADSLPPRLREPPAVEMAERLALATALRLPAPGAGEPLPGAAAADSALLVTALGRGNALAAALRRSGAAVRHVPLNLTADSAALVAQLARTARGAGRLLVADFAASAGRLSLAALARAALPGDSASPRPLLLRFTHDLLDPTGEPFPALVVWGLGRESQAAAARLLLERAPEPERLAGVRWPPAPALAEADPAEVGMDADALRRVDGVIERAIGDSVFPGAALAVGRRGGLVRLRGYGRTAPGEGGAPVSPTTSLYDLASLSKVVGTTAAVALLVDAGRMALDAPLQRYLPEFRGGGREEATVRHLLSHTAGLPAGRWLYGSAGSPREALAQVLRQPLRRPPGRGMEYSDLGMMLLAEGAERAAGMPLDRYLALHLFAPLGMASTQYLPPHALRERAVPTAVRNERELVLRGVVHDANAFRLGGVAGHAGLFSTARDVAVFAQAMLNRGGYGLVEVLSPEVAAGFTRRQRGAGERALGWDTPAPRSSAGRYFSASSFGHTGYTGTSLWIDPERELFVVLLTNRTYTEGTAGEMLRVRAEVHDAVARAVRDEPVRPRRGAR